MTLTQITGAVDAEYFTVIDDHIISFQVKSDQLKDL